MNESSGDEADEARLFQRAAAGDADAFTALFKRHYAMIHAFAYRLCLDSSEAEEIAQDTFVKAARSISNVRNPGSLKSWLFRIAHNVAADFRRSNVRRTALGEEVRLREEGRSEERPMDYSPVREALRTLPDHLREAIVLVYYEEMNHAEAAQILGCAETTVSWRVFTAKRRLKKMLSESAHD